VAHIHPLALVDPAAEIGRDVTIGPFSVVEAGSVIGDGCQLAARVIIKSRTTLGKCNEVGEGTVLGGKAQHVVESHPGGTLVIGDYNRIRENVTIHRGHASDATTIVGDHNYIMVSAHIGHDCRIGNHTIIVNNVMIGGHVHIHDRAYLSGGVAVHQFCRVGQYAMVGGLARVVQDVPPYVTVSGGGETEIVGLNRVGLKRNGFTPDDMLQLKAAYRLIYRQGLRWCEVIEVLERDFSAGPAALFIDFLKSGKRGFIQERRISRKATLKLAPVDSDEDTSEKLEGKRRVEAA
jgi:UDP-N-acetylglucosamine acyltransferase